MACANKPPSKPPDPVTVNPAVQSTVEREIKLAVDNHFRLPPLPGVPLPRRLLTSTYYDTSQYDLAHAGITLRHRIDLEPHVSGKRFREIVLHAGAQDDVQHRKAAPHMDVLREHVEVGQHFRFARAIVIRIDADDLEGVPSEFEIASDCQERVSRRELPPYCHLDGTMLDPSPAHEAHLAMNLVRDRIDAEIGRASCRERV